MKNKVCFFLALLLLLSVAGCIKAGEYSDLNKNYPEISSSMEVFFSLGKEPVVSESFQAVFSDLTKVKYHDSET